MTFERAWLVAVALLPLVWCAIEWRRTRSRPGLLLKALALSAILLALAEPRLSVSETKMAVAVLVDTSVSISDEDLKRASGLAGAIERERGRHVVKLIPFAGETRSPLPSEQGRGWQFQRTRGDAGRATDLETSLRQALAALPAGLVHRVVVISDGRENKGSFARAAWQAQRLGIPIDTYPLDGRSLPSLRVESVTLPSNAFTGERFPIDLTVQSPSRLDTRVEIAAEHKKIGESAATLEPGENRIRVYASLNEAGAIAMSVRLHTAASGEIVFEDTITLRRPRLLYISQDPPGTEAHLLKTLEAAQFEVAQTPEIDSADLSSAQIVVLNNIDLEGIPQAIKADLEDFVKQGGGLLVIGGEKNVYVEESKAVEDPLERALPAKLAPPRSPEGTCVVLIIDKSSSMEGRKMELARLAAIGAIENLRPIDLVGVLIFDNSFQWAVPIRRAEDKTLIKRLIAGITPDGGTQIAPALAEAYRRIIPAKGTYKHIVLLTDGISEEGDSIALAREAAQQRVTISTVGLGQDVNRAYLEKVASFSRGKSYFLHDPSGLEQILIRDVMEHTGTTAIEKPVRPVVVQQAEILEGVGMESAPTLKGYVKFISKPTAETILNVEGNDPLLARWQYGLGRSAVFTSDAKSRWAESWVGWPGFDRFWANLPRDLLPHAPAGEALVRLERASQELVIEYRLASHTPEPEKVPQIFVLGPGDFRRPVEIKKAAEGTYRGRVNVGHRQGLFRIRPLADVRAFPETGFYRQEEELTQYGSDEHLLRQVSEFTGGAFQPRPGQIFNPTGRSVDSTMNLWPALLFAAILLSLAELVLRKWRGIRDALRRRWGAQPQRA